MSGHLVIWTSGNIIIQPPKSFIYPFTQSPSIPHPLSPTALIPRTRPTRVFTFHTMYSYCPSFFSYFPSLPFLRVPFTT